MKKTKTLLGCLATLATVSSIVAPLSSCSAKQSKNYRVGEEFDEEYDINNSTYLALMDKFRKEWDNKMTVDHPEWSKERFNVERKNFNKTLSTLDEVLGATLPESQRVNSFTHMTQTVINYAQKLYGIKLTRDNVSADWPDITAMFKGIQNSFIKYMESSGFDDDQIDFVIEQSNKSFNNLMNGEIDGNQFGLRYKYKDPLAALIEAKSQILSCFTEVNDGIALLGASNQLNEFLKTYQISYEVHENEDNTFDKLFDKGILVEGTDLSPYMASIFSIKDTLHPDRVISKFEPNKMIPGYTVTPKIRTIVTNKYTNKYEIHIDWNCVKSDYITNNKTNIEDVTAHLYRDFDEDAVDISKMSLSDVTTIFKSSNVSTISYSIPLSADQEKAGLEAAYFTGEKFKYDVSETKDLGKIQLGWFSNEKKGYEQFWQGRPINDQQANGVSTLEVQGNNLISAGLEVKIQQPESNEFGEPEKLSKWYTPSDSSVIVDMTEPRTEDAGEIPAIVSSLVENCAVFSDVNVTKDDETGTVTNSINLAFNNSPYKHRETLNTYVLPSTTNQFEPSDSTYAWLTSEFNNISDMLDKYGKEPNEYTEKWEAACKMCAITSSVWTVAQLLNILNVVCGIKTLASPNKAKIVVFVVDSVLVLAMTACDSASYGIFMDKYYMPTKKRYEAALELEHSNTLANLYELIGNQQAEMDLLRKNSNNEIKKSDYERNCETFLKNKKFWGEGGIKESIDFFTDFYDTPAMSDFYKTLRDYNAGAQDYEDIMEEWENEGHFITTTSSLGTASLILAGAQIGWLVACGIHRSPDPMEQNLHLQSNIEQKWTQEQIDHMNQLVKDINEGKVIYKGEKMTEKIQETSTRIIHRIPCYNKSPCGMDVKQFIDNVAKEIFALAPAEDKATLIMQFRGAIWSKISGVHDMNAAGDLLGACFRKPFISGEGRAANPFLNLTTELASASKTGVAPLFNNADQFIEALENGFGLVPDYMVEGFKPSLIKTWKSIAKDIVEVTGLKGMGESISTFEEFKAAFKHFIDEYAPNVMRGVMRDEAKSLATASNIVIPSLFKFFSRIGNDYIERFAQMFALHLV